MQHTIPTFLVMFYWTTGLWTLPCLVYLFMLLLCYSRELGVINSPPCRQTPGYGYGRPACLYLQGHRAGGEGNLHVWQKIRQVRCPTVFDISVEQLSTHENTTQGSKQEGISLAPWWGQSCLHWSVPTPRSCQRPRLKDHNHESKSARRDRGRRQMIKTQRKTREKNWGRRRKSWVQQQQ
jgi:hypothetical protein